MQIQFILTSENPLDLEILRAIADLTRTTPVETPHTESVPGQEAPTKPPKGRKPAKSESPATTPAAPAPAPVPAPAAPAPVQPAAPASEEALKAFAEKYDKVLGIAKLKEHLAKAGVRRLSELPSEPRAAFIAEREAELKAALEAREVA